MFWDLRVSGLEAQALEPIESLEEMRGDAYGEADALKEVRREAGTNRRVQNAFQNAPSAATSR